MTKPAATPREVRDLFRTIGERGRDARLFVSEINVEERIGVPILATSVQQSSVTLSDHNMLDSFTAITNGRFLIVAAGSAFEVHSLTSGDLSLIESQAIAWIANQTALASVENS